MIAEQERMKAGRLQAAGQRQPRIQIGRLRLHAHRYPGHETSMPVAAGASLFFCGWLTGRPSWVVPVATVQDDDLSIQNYR
jgi:hypothetical protein